MKEYSFTPVQLKEIPLKKYPKDFTFILNGQCYQTSRLVTDLLSPTIRCSSLLDDTIQQFEIKINDKDADIDNHSIEYFDNLIQSILTNSTLSINDHNRRFYIQLFFQLGNIDEYIKFAPSFENEISLQTVFDRINAIKLFYSQTSSESSTDDSVQSHEFSRYVRYRHEGPCWSNSSKDLSIQTIEFYGNLQNFTPKGGMQ